MTRGNVFFRLLLTVKNNIKVRERFRPLKNNITTGHVDCGIFSEWGEEKDEIIQFLERRCQFSDPGGADILKEQ